MRIKQFFLPALLAIFCSPLVAQGEHVLLPRELKLTTPDAQQRLLLQRKSGDEIGKQVTDEIAWESSDPKVATVSSEGIVTPTGNGQTRIVARVNGSEQSIPVTVENYQAETSLSFRHDVLPVLSKAGCNSGACHGALAGKGGFRLSLLGYDPPSDHFNMVKQNQGRRIEFAEPGRSLILAKPSGGLPHKGGIRFETDSPEYALLSHWISSGAPAPRETDPEITQLNVLPARSIHTLNEEQQLIVQAKFSDGEVRDVTPRVIWSSTNEAVCSVDEEGKVTINGPGEGAIVAWYSSLVEVARITVPYPDVSDPLADEDKTDQRPPRNFIDELINKQLARLNLLASPACSDEAFVRRAYIDTVGRLPTADEVKTFLDQSGDGKRDELIETLLASEDFVDYWTYQWSDVLMINGNLLRPQAVKAYYEWIRGHVAENTSWDDVVREIVTATGSSLENGATNFYALNQTPEEMTENVSKAFLGLSIGCAKCHNHPLEKWTNDQYYGMANLFARVKAKGWGGESRNGDGLRTLYVTETGDLVQPRTGKPQPPRPLDQPAIPIDDPEDRRKVLAEWLTSPDNPYFARSIANRVWSKFFGVGLVEEVDDMRLSNPASNDELMQATADYLVKEDFDLKSLMRKILQSNAYQRTSQPLPGNREEKRFYSRYYPRRMMSEVLHDAIVQVTDVPTEFNFVSFPGADRQKTDFYPKGTRAIELYDSAVENYFLETFGRNPRNIVCECERSATPSTVQVLHLSNGETINQKLKADTSRVAELMKERQNGLEDKNLVEGIYLTALGRHPREKEQRAMLEMLPPPGDPQEREALEDIFWAILTTREFLFNH